MKANETLDAQGSILWNKAKLKRFKKTYQHALGNSITQFTFDGHEFLTSYAKYLIEYLEAVLK